MEDDWVTLAIILRGNEDKIKEIENFIDGVLEANNNIFKVISKKSFEDKFWIVPKKPYNYNG